MTTNFLTVEMVVEIHKELVKSAKIEPGFNFENMLALCMETVPLKLGQLSLYHSSMEKGLFYVYYLTKKRPFNDGNKRVAIEAWKKFYEINGYRLSEEDIADMKRLVKLIGCDMITKEDLLYFSQCFQANEWGNSLLYKP